MPCKMSMRSSSRRRSASRLFLCVSFVALNSYIELRKIEVDEVARLARLPALDHPLLRHRLDRVVRKPIPNRIEHVVLVVLALRARKRFNQVVELIHEYAIYR